jgi:predicted MPP superfamily phosphohydrolase
LNTADHHLDQGLFNLKNSRLYVSRGVGYIRRIRFYCRPEVPIFRLVAAT